jgi:hypothetical protein
MSVSDLIDVTIKGPLIDFRMMAKQFPEITARILGYIGKQAALELAGKMQSGTYGITYRSMNGNRKSDFGKRMITYSIGRGLTWVRVSSFPLNLFEGGRGLRSGTREAPRNIIRGKLKAIMKGKINGLMGDAEKFIVDDWFNKRHKGGLNNL